MALVDKLSEAIKAIGHDIKALIDNKVDKSALGSAAYKDLGTNVDEVVTAQNAFIASANIGVEDYYGSNLDPKFDVNDMVSGQKALVNTNNLNTPPRTSKETIYHIECKRLHEGKYEDYLLFIAYGYITGEVYTRVKRGDVYTPWIHTSQSVDNYDRITNNSPNIYVHTDGKLYRSKIAENLVQARTDLNVTTVDGWYTIAVLPDRYTSTNRYYQRAYADFLITENASGKHTTISFKAGITYGQNPCINVLGVTGYNKLENTISDIRIKYGNTYGGAILQLKVRKNCRLHTIKMSDNFCISGFTLLSKPALQGSEEEASSVEPLIDLSKLIYNRTVALESSASAIFSKCISCSGINIKNTALISNYTGNNIYISRNMDHLWHSVRDNTWHFCSDTSYKAQGNSNVQAGSVSSGPASYTRAWRKLTDKTFGNGASTLTVAHGVINISGLSVKAIKDGTTYYANDVRSEYQFTVESTDADVIVRKSADATGLDGASIEIYIDEDMS